MKLSTFIFLLIVLGIGGWYLHRTPAGTWIERAIRGSFHPKPEPKETLDEMAKKLPRTLHPGEPVTEVSTYIEKRDDPIVPLLGYLTFVGFSRYEYVFTWETDHWIFSQLRLRDRADIAHDITDTQPGMEIMNSPEMVRFLAPYRSLAMPDITVQNAPATPAARPYISVVPRRTPTPQEQAVDIARKYGAPR